MSTTTEPEATIPTVTFPPTEHKTVIFDLSTRQILALGPAVSVGLLVLLAMQSLLGIAVAVAVVALGSGAAFGHVRIGDTRRTPVDWAPVAASWVGDRLAGGSRRWVRPMPEHLVEAATGRVVPADPVVAGGPLHGVAIHDWTLADGTPFGAVLDRPMGRWVAMVEVRGRDVAMIETAELVRLQSRWGKLTDSLGREAGAVTRFAWVSDAGAVDELAATRWLRTRAVVPEDHPARQAQEELIGAGGHAAPEHRLLVVLGMDPRRARRGILRQGGGLEGACEVLAGELARLRADLTGAGLVVERVLSQREVATTLRVACEPAEAPKLAVLAEAGAPGLEPSAAGPRYWDVRSDHIEAAGSFHIAGQVEAWPGSTVGIDFLADFLADPSISRRLTQVVAPLAPLAAMRQVGSKLAAAEASEELKRRHGFLSRARARRRLEAAEAEDEALAHGHGLNREATVAVVSAPTLEDAEAAWSRLETAAAGALVRLERATGRQQAVFMASLPLARGLR